MSDLIRLDKYLANLRIGSRKEVKDHIRKGKVSVNNQIVTDSAHKVNINEDVVYFDNRMLSYEKYIYFMLNKPAGLVSATTDKRDKTVVDIIDKKYQKDLFPVGRLDKDTEGLLILTNDGQLAHRLLSPKNKVPKTYYALVRGQVTNETVAKFEQGIVINKDFTTLPAHLEILESGTNSKVYLTIYEGKFHQVKRMFKALNMTVTYLKRVKFASLNLDESLEPGEYRALTDDEIKLLRKT